MEQKWDYKNNRKKEFKFKIKIRKVPTFWVSVCEIFRKCY